MNAKIYCPDIECESCIKVITRSIKKIQGIEDLSFDRESVTINYNPEQIQQEELTKLINSAGFRASLQPFPRKTFLERLRDFKENKTKYQVEYQMLKYSVAILAFLLLLEGIAYYTFFRTTEGFLQRYGWWFFYLTLAITSLGSAVWHFKSYKAQFTNMTGMMIGMTFGMQSGMMLGTIFGATNGLVTGGTTAMVLAVLLGVYNGKCCGIMGVLEGMMAGIMGGIMGSMIGVMYAVDHILIFMPFFMFFNLIVMFGLSYMLFEEVVEHNPKTKRQPIDFLTFFSFCFIATTILITWMVYGPKTGIASII